MTLHATCPTWRIDGNEPVVVERDPSGHGRLTIDGCLGGAITFRAIHAPALAAHLAQAACRIGELFPAGDPDPDSRTGCDDRGLGMDEHPLLADAGEVAL